MKTVVREHGVLLFITLTVLLSWIVFFLPLPSDVRPLLTMMQAALVPLPVALGLTAVEEGGAGVRRLLGTLLDWRMSVQSFLFIVGLAVALRLGVSLLALVTTVISSLSFGSPSPLLGLMALVFAVTEEIGWRAYALPRLLRRYSPLTAALILGLPWAIIHAGLTLPGLPFAGSSAPAYMMLTVMLSVILTWIYVQSGGRLMAVVLLHAGQTFTGFFNANITGPDQVWLMALTYSAIALVLIVISGSSFQRDTDAVVGRSPRTSPF